MKAERSSIDDIAADVLGDQMLESMLQKMSDDDKQFVVSKTREFVGSFVVPLLDLLHAVENDSSALQALKNLVDRKKST